MVTKEERREQKRIYLKEYRAFWRAHEICMKCGKEKAFHRYSLCAGCLEKERERKSSHQRYRDADFRHFMRYLATPHGVDEENGLPHLWHCATNIAFLCELEDDADDGNI